MIYGLFIQESPTRGEGFNSAARFATALLGRGHQLRQIFLYGDAVLAAAYAHPSALKGFNRLMAVSAEHAIPVLACQAAIERLNIEAIRHPGIALGSLGQWFDAMHELDRVVSFTG